MEYKLLKLGSDYSTEKIQNAIRSAPVTKVYLDEREIFIKKKAEEIFSEILNKLELEYIPTNDQKDKRTNAYLHIKKWKLP